MEQIFSHRVFAVLSKVFNSVMCLKCPLTVRAIRSKWLRASLELCRIKAPSTSLFHTCWLVLNTPVRTSEPRASHNSGKTQQPDPHVELLSTEGEGSLKALKHTQIGGGEISVVNINMNTVLKKTTLKKATPLCCVTVHSTLKCCQSTLLTSLK